MIKKIFMIALVSLFIMNLSGNAFCDDQLKKLGRGLSNVLTCPLELPEQTSRTNNSDGPFAALTVGVLKGLGMTVARACVGIYEAATFLMPYPKDFKPILKDPEYFLENSNF